MRSLMVPILAMALLAMATSAQARVWHLANHDPSIPTSNYLQGTCSDGGGNGDCCERAINGTTRIQNSGIRNSFALGDTLKICGDVNGEFSERIQLNGMWHGPWTAAEVDLFDPAKRFTVVPSEDQPVTTWTNYTAGKATITVQSGFGHGYMFSGFPLITNTANEDVIYIGSWSSNPVQKVRIDNCGIVGSPAVGDGRGIAGGSASNGIDSLEHIYVTDCTVRDTQSAGVSFSGKYRNIYVWNTRVENATLNQSLNHWGFYASSANRSFGSAQSPDWASMGDGVYKLTDTFHYDVERVLVKKGALMLETPATSSACTDGDFFRDGNDLYIKPDSSVITSETALENTRTTVIFVNTWWGEPNKIEFIDCYVDSVGGADGTCLGADQGSSSVLIEKLTTKNCKRGVETHQAYNVTIRNVISTGNDMGALIGGENITVSHFTSVDDDTGIRFLASSNSAAYNSVIQDALVEAVTIQNSGAVAPVVEQVVEYGSVSAGSATETLTSAPLDMSYQPLEIIRDRGVSGPWLSGADFAGNPQYGKPDLGAYEYLPAGCLPF